MDPHNIYVDPIKIKYVDPHKIYKDWPSEKYVDPHNLCEDSPSETCADPRKIFEDLSYGKLLVHVNNVEIHMNNLKMRCILLRTYMKSLESQI